MESCACKTWIAYTGNGAWTRTTRMQIRENVKRAHVNATAAMIVMDLGAETAAAPHNWPFFQRVYCKYQGENCVMHVTAVKSPFIARGYRNVGNHKCLLRHAAFKGRVRQRYFYWIKMEWSRSASPRYIHAAKRSVKSPVRSTSARAWGPVHSSGPDFHV